MYHQVSLEQLENQIGKLSEKQQGGESKALVFLFSGQSGAGKDSIIQSMVTKRPNLHFVVTAATRPKRANEVDGKDYLFVSKEQFEQWIKDDQMFEYAQVYGEYKGVPKFQILEPLKKGIDVIMRVDVQGAATLRKLVPNLVTIFVAVDSERGLAKRLLSRKTDDIESVKRRMVHARNEIDQIKHFDYVLVNQDGHLEESVDKALSIMDVEKIKTKNLNL